MPQVLVSNIMMLNERDRFDAELRSRGFEPIWPEVSQFMDEAQCMGYAGQIDGWLAGDDRVTRAVMEAALPRLKVIAKWGTGLDSIDLVAAKELGLPVLNSPGAFAHAVGECAIGYMLMLMRDLGLIDRQIRAGHWPKPRGVSPRGKTMGVIGFGAIGQCIGRLASGLGMEVIFADPFMGDPIDMGGKDATPTELADLAKDADVVAIACSLTAENHHMIDGAFLEAMKPDAFLINVARGPLVQEAALVTALNAGKLAGVALDVFEDEPLFPDSPLRQFDRVILGSHNCNNEISAVEYVHANTLNNLASVLSS